MVNKSIIPRIITVILLTLSILPLILTAQEVNEELLENQFNSALQAFQEEDFSKAHGLFDYCHQIAGATDHAPSALFLKALSSYKLQNWNTAINEFSNFLQKYGTSSLKPKAVFYLGNAYFKINRFTEAAEQFLYFYNRPDSLRTRAFQSLNRLLSGYFTINELYALKRNYQGNREEGYIHYFLIERLHNQNSHLKVIEEAKQYLAKLPDGYNHKEVQKILQSAQDYLDQKDITIAVLLPLSGKYQQYGNTLMEGIELKVDEFNETEHRDVGLIKVDTKGDPLHTLQKCREVVFTYSPVAIIGPLLSECTVALALLAEQNNVPVITPTASQYGLSNISTSIFQLSTPLEVAANSLAQFALDSLKDTSFAALVPNTQFGRTVTEKFFEIIEKADKNIVDIQFYEDGTIDFTEYLNRIKQPVLEKYESMAPEVDSTDSNWYSTFYDDNKRRLPKSEWEVKIDALLLTSYEEDLETILPQVPFNYISTNIFGCNGWHIEKIQDIDQNSIDTLFFIPSNEYIDENRSAWRIFVNKFRQKYNSAPDKFSALGYDAAELITSGIAKGTSDASLLQDYLSGITLVDGAAGKIAFNKHGANSYSPIIRYVNGNFSNIQH